MRIKSAVVFGARLRWARKHKRMTQQELAERIDVTRGTIARWETLSDVPSAKVMYSIAIALGVNMGFLLGYRPEDQWEPMVYMDNAEQEYLAKLRRLSPEARQMIRNNVDDMFVAVRQPKLAAKV